MSEAQLAIKEGGPVLVCKHGFGTFIQAGKGGSYIVQVGDFRFYGLEPVWVFDLADFDDRPAIAFSLEVGLA